MTPRVFLTHPNRQYSHQTARALQEEGMLSLYCTGVPARPVFKNTSLRPIGRMFEKYTLIDEVPDEKIVHRFWGPLARRVSLPFPARYAVPIQHLGMAAFDWTCARMLDSTDATVVAAAENGALYTFQRAKAQGMTTVLEAASFHHGWQDRFYSYPESESIHARINARKNQEIELADRIHTVSELARQSYIEAGVPEEKVEATTIGCDLTLFQPRCSDGDQGSTEPFTFIFAGHAGRRKGTDTLIEACVLLDKRGVEYQVWVAGATNTALSWEKSNSIERLGWLPHDKLTQRYRAADCFVLPSRHDSFGMVVVEAMACGTPAIVTNQTGAAEAVTDDVSGWIIDADDPVQLADYMEWCVSHPEKVLQMRPEARAAAEHYGWGGYNKRVKKAYRSLPVQQ